MQRALALMSVVVPVLLRAAQVLAVVPVLAAQVALRAVLAARPVLAAQVPVRAVRLRLVAALLRLVALALRRLALALALLRLLVRAAWPAWVPGRSWPALRPWRR